MNVQDPQNIDEKTMAILQAAWEVFRVYGFRRTSMEDIAQAADMSRAALYLQFKNKADIFRGLISLYYANTVQEFRAALTQEGAVEDNILAGFQALSGDSFRALLNSPHGPELLDAKATASGEVVAQGEAALSQTLTTWLETQSNAGRIRLDHLGADAGSVAKMMLRAYYGLKAGPPDYADFARERDQLARLYGAGLTVAR